MSKEQSFEALFKASPSACIVLKPDAPRFTIFSVNEAYLQATGTREEDIIGKGIFEALPANPGEAGATSEKNLRASLAHVLAHKEKHAVAAQKYDIPVRGTGQLELKYWNYVNVPVLDSAGEIEYIIHSASDVTGQVVAEEQVKTTRFALARKKEHYRSLFDNHPDAVVSFDLEGNFLTANEAVVRITECTMEELLRITFMPFVAPEDVDRVSDHFKLAAVGQVQNYNCGMITAKGNRLVVNVTNIPMVVDGEVIGVYGIGKDITKFVEDKKHLKESQEKLQRTLDFSLDVICTIGLDKSFISVSKAAENVFGYRPEELEGRIYLDFVHAGDREMTRAVSDQIRQGIEVKRLENRIVRKDGKIISISWSIHWDDNEKVSYCIGRDITEIKASNERIKYNEMRFRTLMQNSAEGIALMNAEKAVIEASPSAFKILGMEGTDPSQLSFALVHPDDLHVALGVFEAALERPGEMRSAEIRVLSANNEYKWIEVCYHNQLSEPSVEAVVTNFREITDRKLAMEKVEANERRFRTLLENSTDGLALVAADGIVLEISNSGRKILGYSENEIVGRLRPDLIHPDDLAKVGQAFIDVREHPEMVVCFQYRFLSPDGSYRWIEANFQNQLGEPAVGAMVMNFRDVTEKIDRIRSIEEQNLKLREIAWMQSHMVRAPLSRIMGLVDVMRNYPDHHLNGLDVLNALQASANELDQVIRTVVKRTEAVDNNSLNGTPPGD